MSEISENFESIWTLVTIFLRGLPNHDMKKYYILLSQSIPILRQPGIASLILSDPTYIHYLIEYNYYDILLKDDVETLKKRFTEPLTPIDYDKIFRTSVLFGNYKIPMMFSACFSYTGMREN